MLIIQYLIFLIYLQISDFFVLLDIPLKSNEEKPPASSYYSTNSYYSLQNTNSSLIDYMKTLYEQEKQNNKQFDYNVIRALAPRLGKIILRV